MVRAADPHRATYLTVRGHGRHGPVTVTLRHRDLTTPLGSRTFPDRDAAAVFVQATLDAWAAADRHASD